jgi:DNA repair protein RecN (Recombination protein N)
LISLQIRDFAIVDEIDVEFSDGMTVLTGETGAGKSILVDALGLVLGDRGSSTLVREGAKRAEFSAEFAVGTIPAAMAWLEENALDDEDTCLLRRVINADGRSRAFVNGNAVPLQQLKSLGDLLVDIHGQHFHQSLGRRSVQRDLLDHYGGLLEAREAAGSAFAHWQSLREHLRSLQEADADRDSRIDLLTFQLQELESLGSTSGEYEELKSASQRLANSEKIAAGVSDALARLSDDDMANASKLITMARRALEDLQAYDATFGPLLELLASADIQVSEATDSLRRYGDSIDADPAEQNRVEERLNSMQSIARKHRVEPSELPGLAERLRESLSELNNAEERGKALETETGAARAAYLEQARRLSEGRRAAARDFSSAVSGAMSGLGMPGGVFVVEVTPLAEESFGATGADNIEFNISANPGQPPMPLSRVASGGELSRMSLAIQVIASGGNAIPTMVFDEVDSGVGGGVAEMVGRRLAEVANGRQVLCVTHLPQVASLADQHLRISKVTDGTATRTGVAALDHEERIDELARMLGGVEITRKTRAHAAEMLDGAPKKRA